MGAKRSVLFIAVLMLAAGAATAQTAGVVTLRANSTSASGSHVPVLTWSTNPVATSCRASGGWSGDKAASGSQTLASINATTNYTLTCSWGAGSTRVSWVPPTTNTNGTALTNLAGFKVYYGTSSSALTSSVTVNNVAARDTTISSLAPGTWYFAVRALNTSQVESENSNIATKVVAGATAAGSVRITITSPTPVPPPPPPTPPPSGTLLTTSVDVYDVSQQSNGTWSARAIVGRIALGRPCSTAFTANNGYYQINRNDVTRNSVSPWSNIFVARCATSSTPVPPTPEPPPTPPPTGTLQTTSVDVYDVLAQSNGSWSVRAIVGRIALGRPCSTAFSANGGHFQINRNDVTRNSVSPWSNIFVARCATN